MDVDFPVHGGKSLKGPGAGGGLILGLQLLLGHDFMYEDFKAICVHPPLSPGPQPLSLVLEPCFKADVMSPKLCGSAGKCPPT